MAKHLNDYEIGKIVALLLGWKSALSWEALSDACEKIIGRCPSRQTLADKPRVVLAYNAAKDRLKKRRAGETTATPDSMHVAFQRIARLEAENVQIKAENNLLLQQFVTWQYNAYKAGLSADRLNEPLPPIDLNPS